MNEDSYLHVGGRAVHGEEMVGQAKLRDVNVFFCQICKLAHGDEATAASCEKYCGTHPACAVEIGRKAVGAVPGPDERFKDWA
ncbi:MAG: hypothetical protein HY556_03090 [Euryarchaeota archaeon]|nr:hypothetical protein [Euryarchaeota archaeon]